MNLTNLTWDRDGANEYSLWTAEGDDLCSILREYDQRPCASGFSNEVNDTDSPMRWIIVRPGQPTRSLGTPGLTVRQAKKLAESIIAGA